MSCQALIVITNLLTVLPIVKMEFLLFIWSGIIIGCFTLRKIFAIHFLCPFCKLNLIIVLLWIIFLPKYFVDIVFIEVDKFIFRVFIIRDLLVYSVIINCLNFMNVSGTLTCFTIIETLSNDLSAFTATNVISITDGQLFLDLVLFGLEMYPSVSIGKSVSRFGAMRWDRIYNIFIQRSSMFSLFYSIVIFCCLHGFCDLVSIRYLKLIEYCLVYCDILILVVWNLSFKYVLLFNWYNVCSMKFSGFSLVEIISYLISYLYYWNYIFRFYVQRRVLKVVIWSPRKKNF